MVCVDIFELDSLSQTLRTLFALLVLIVGDLFYLFLLGNFSKFWKNKLAYLTTWIIISITLGVCILKNDEGEYYYDHSRRDHAYYGILIALFVYIPLNVWLVSSGYLKPMQGLYYTAYGIFITAIASLFVYMLAESSELIKP